MVVVLVVAVVLLCKLQKNQFVMSVFLVPIIMCTHPSHREVKQATRCKVFAKVIPFPP